MMGLRVVATGGTRTAYALMALLLLTSSTVRVSCQAVEAKALEVFMVPHSHCDTGYKKTTEGYYLTEVKYVLNSVTDYLETRPQLRFLWSEGAYLWRWWKDEPRRFAVFKRLVEKGQIELVNGGWTMHDEAITSYDAQITQTRMGHELLRAMGFGVEQLPRIGWQPDPFGPSSWTPTLMALSGYDAWVTNRIPDPIKDACRKNRTLQFVWEGSNSIPAAKSYILTHVLDTHYESPAGFDWEPPTPASTAVPVTQLTLTDRADAFVSTMATRAAWYSTPVLLVPLGGDFEYQNASINFENMSLIMDFVSANPDRYVTSLGLRVNMRYATLSDYFRRLQEVSPTLPVLRSSPFLPLVSGEGGMAAGTWSGYYSGYPVLKEAARHADTLLRTAEVLLSLSGVAASSALLSISSREALEQARRDINLMPHHDNLPATGYNFNNVDLEVNLKRATRVLQGIIADATAALATSSTDGSGPAGASSSSSMVMTMDGDVLRTIDDGQAPVPVVLVNSAGWARTEVVEVRVSRQDLVVTDSKGETVPSQVLKDEREDGSFRLFFEARVAALGWKTYFIGSCLLTHWTLSYPKPATCAYVSTVLNATDLLAKGIENSRYALHFSSGDCTLDSVLVKASSKKVDLRQSFHVYTSPGDSVYMFKPTTAAQPRPLTGCQVFAQVGPLVQEVTVTSAVGIEFMVRLLNSTDESLNSLIMLSHKVGGLAPFENLVTRLDTSLSGASYSYHENGYERRSADYDANKSVGNNYKPFVSRSALLTPGGDLDLHVCGHAPHGTMSPGLGRLELMLHRRAAYQPLRGNDQSTAVLSPLWLILDTPASAESLATSWATLLQSPLAVVMATDPSLHVKSSWSGLPTPLPSSINLLTFSKPAFSAGMPGSSSSSSSNSFTLQLEHLVDKASGGQPVEVSLELSEVLRLRRSQQQQNDRMVRGSSSIIKCEERTITGAYPIQRLAQRMTWKTTEAGAEQPAPPATGDLSCGLRQDLSKISLTVRPKDICTIVCSF